MSSGLENNKIFASILTASLIVLMSGFITDIIYKPDLKPQTRGYEVAIEGAQSAVAKEAEKIIDIKTLMSEASSELGQKVFRKCISCHTITKNGPNKVGPNLWNIVGKKKSSKEDFNYSKVLSEMGGVWDYENLYRFLNKPSKYARGTKMAFIGLKKPEEIAAVIAYLEQYVSD